MPVDDPGWNTNLSAVQEIDPHPMTGGLGGNGLSDSNKVPCNSRVKVKRPTKHR